MSLLYVSSKMFNNGDTHHRILLYMYRIMKIEFWDTHTLKKAMIILDIKWVMACSEMSKLYHFRQLSYHFISKIN